MRHRRILGTAAACLLLLTPTIDAQDLGGAVRDAGATASQHGPCSAWRPGALRGAYSFTATAWQNLSEINPALPAGYAPVTIIGTFRVNGNGDVTGFAVVNAGGLHLTAEFVNSQFGIVKPDCSFPITLSMQIAEFGEALTGPYPYVGVVASAGPQLEIAFMMLGAGSGSHVELDRAKRIAR